MSEVSLKLTLKKPEQALVSALRRDTNSGSIMRISILLNLYILYGTWSLKSYYSFKNWPNSF